MPDRLSLADSVRHDLRSAVRSLARSPGFLVAATLSLALGIGSAVAAFGVIDAIRFRSLPFPNADRLVILSEVPTDVPTQANCPFACDVSYVTYAQVLRDRPLQTLDAVAAFSGGGKVYNAGGEPVLVTAGVVSPNTFALLGARPVLGRALTPDDDRLGAAYVTVLSHEMWTTQFASDRSIIGRDVKFSDTHYTVVGVMQPGFDFEVGSDFWLPTVPTLDPSTRPSIRSVSVVGRLKPGRTLAQLKSELATVETASPDGGPVKTPMRLDAAPLRERYVASTQSHDVIFAVMVGCVLLIACANLANLSLVRTLARQREFAVRAALGARTSRLARLLLVQHLLIVALATALGLLFARWLLNVLSTLATMNALRPVGMEYRVDLRAVVFAALLAAVIAVVLSFVPARVVARGDSGILLREGAPSGGGGSRSRVQQAFVVAQIASAFVLLTGAGLLGKSVSRLARLDTGFEAARVIQGAPSYPHPWRVKEKYVPVTERILSELRSLPGARSVGLSASVPFGYGGKAEVYVDGVPGPLSPALVPQAAISVSPDYFATLGIPATRGRVFGEQDVENGLPVAVVNEWTARRWWPGGDAIGRTIRVDTAAGKPATLTVVGVIADNLAARPSLLFSEPGPEIYRPYLQAPSAFPTFYLLTTGEPAPLLKPTRDLLVREVPDRPVFAQLFSDTIGQQLDGVRANAWQVLGVAAVGLVLAVLGVHGVLSYAVRRRTREIGIRGAIGARRADILTMVLRDALRLTLAGLVVGLPATLWASRLIEGLLHGTSPTDPVVYALVALGVAVVSLVASAIPAARAMRVAPIIALRTE